MSRSDKNFLRRSSEFRGSEPITKRGFYGCVGGVVRLETVDYFPLNIRVSCPACGHTHVVHPFWRKLIPTLDSNTPDLVLEKPSA